MVINLEFAELHSPLFLGKKNHGLKLFHKDGMMLQYDRQEKELLAYFGGKTAIIPSSNVSSMTPRDPSAKDEVQTPVGPRGKVKAQISTPQDHVFHEGPGKSRD